MDAKVYISDYAQRANKFINLFFARKIKEVKNLGSGKAVTYAIDMLKRYQKFSMGGKKLRGSWIQLGYEIAGGNKKEVLAASTCIEIIHSFLLMHDDIQDKDDVRRSAPTIHKQYETKGKRLKFQKDNLHYGISMGINMGDLGSNIGFEVLLSSKHDPQAKIKAVRYLSRLLQRVAFGQGMDVTFEQQGQVTQNNVLDIHLHKTSIYTVGGPLKIGAYLGGAKLEVVKAMEKFGEPVGIAFQLRDDELGLFSDEHVLGKPIGSDIKEGKNTILRIKAIENASPSDKKFLRYAYGNRNLKRSGVKKVQQITVKTGAFEYSQKLSRKLVEKGKRFIPKITSDREFGDTLSNLADFMITRES